ncbi:MAG: hypothetical protein RMK80_09905, partial [Pseudobdellovibrionaceae bacterium]|nr:hypothetical protein [Pseudobdellovibrionaceae bacterium]
LFSGSGSFWGRRLEGKMIKTENKLVLSRGDLEAKKLSESYDVVLGEGFLDLDGIRKLDKTRSVKINVVLGRLHLVLPKKIPYSMRLNSVLSKSSGLTGTYGNMDETRIVSPLFDEQKPYLDIELDLVLSNLKIKESVA